MILAFLYELLAQEGGITDWVEWRRGVVSQAQLSSNVIATSSVKVGKREVTGWIEWMRGMFQAQMCSNLIPISFLQVKEMGAAPPSVMEGQDSLVQDLGFAEPQPDDLEHLYKESLAPLQIGTFDSSLPRAYNR
jgi:hypothetical protein